MNALAEERFLTLLEAHKRILYKVANAYCRDHDQRQDLVQEMTVQLWRSFGRYDEGQRFSTWMYRVVMNVAISTYRSAARRIRTTLPVEDFALELAAADQITEASHDVRLVYRLIQQLDAMNRALILLYLDGYTHDEIAGITGITTTNVATRVNRIKQRLRSEFDAA
jgi:RNA polymerase sigma-70 factor (ECF subfamily)